MKYPLSILILSLLFLSHLNATGEKKATVTKNISGVVTMVVNKITRTYKIGSIAVSNSSRKHVERHVGKQVSATCDIRDNIILRVRSIEVGALVASSKGKQAKTTNLLLRHKQPKTTNLFSKRNESDLSGTIAVSNLRQKYLDSPSKTIGKYRKKNLTFSATATGIKNYKSTQFRISLSKTHGKLIVDKAALSDALRKRLWEIPHKGPLNITFSASWESSLLSALILKNVKSIK